MSDQEYRWLQLLKIEHIHNGGVDLDYLARLAALKTAEVEDILDGSLLPDRAQLARLIRAITTNKDMHTLVLAEWDEEVDGADDPRPAVASGWLQNLRIVRYANGQLSLNKIAQRSGLSHTYVGMVFKDKTIPRRATLVKIIDAITTDTAEREHILAVYDTEVTPTVRAAPTPVRNGEQPKSDLRLLADAVNNLAEAIWATSERKEGR